MTLSESLPWRYGGARWWKFDFHTHTPASKDYRQSAQHASTVDVTPQDWLLSFMRAGLDCVAVTDHNSGEWIDKLKSSLQGLRQEQHPEYRELHLFPGVEITANGGIHILAIFDTSKCTADIDSLLGAISFQGERGSSDRTADDAPIRVVDSINRAGGIAIPAHVDRPSGAWDLRGNTLRPLLESDELFAIEIVEHNSAKPALYDELRLSWAEVLGSDSHRISQDSSGRYPGSHYTWVKMAGPSLEGLRLALLDGEGYSIRRSDLPESFDPAILPKHHIESIEIRDARFMGRGQPTRLALSPWLSALIGGRGTGKSTVIHAIRLAARRERELKNLDKGATSRATFERFNRVPSTRVDEGGITNSTMIRWTIMRDGIRYRVRWQSDGSELSVEEESGDGEWTASQVQDVAAARFPIRLFSQGQIADLAGNNQQALLAMIDEAAGVAAHQESLDSACNSFYRIRARIRELDHMQTRRDSLTVELGDVERKLRRFEESGHSRILTSYRHRDRQSQHIERHFNNARITVDQIREAATEVQPEDLALDLFDGASSADEDVISIVGALNEVVSDASTALLNTAEKLRQSIESQQSNLTQSVWRDHVDQSVQEYATLVEILQTEGIVDPNEYGRWVQERRRIEGELERLASEEDELRRLVAESEDRLQTVLNERREISKARDAFLSEVVADDRLVRIGLVPYGEDVQVVERSLREVLHDFEHFEADLLPIDSGTPDAGIVGQLLGTLPEEIEARSSEIETRLHALRKRFIGACRGRGDFGGHFNNFLERNFTQGPQFLDNLLTWFPEDSLRVMYSRSGDGTDFSPIAQASAGQRSAAMLSFLLTHGEEPLVLDQPEDDLDNYLIYDLVVRQIRENKLRRQIVVVTHNPNIVVNGDAEIVHVLQYLKGQCVIAQSGSLQEQAMRDEVCRVMEGGREAFERRYRRLERARGDVR